MAKLKLFGKGKDWKKRVWEECKIVYYVNEEKVEEPFRDFFAKRPFFHVIDGTSPYVKLLVAFGVPSNEVTCLPKDLIVTTITPLAWKTLKPVFKWGYKHDFKRD